MVPHYAAEQRGSRNNIPEGGSSLLGSASFKALPRRSPRERRRKVEDSREKTSRGQREDGNEGKGR